MTQLELLIKGCIKGDSSSQEAIYSKYAPLMLGIAMRLRRKMYFKRLFLRY